MLNQRVTTNQMYSNQPRNQQSVSTLSEGSENWYFYKLSQVIKSNLMICIIVLKYTKYYNTHFLINNSFLRCHLAYQYDNLPQGKGGRS